MGFPLEDKPDLSEIRSNTWNKTGGDLAETLPAGLRNPRRNRDGACVSFWKLGLP